MTDTANPSRTAYTLARGEVARSGGVVRRPAGPGIHFGLNWVRTTPGTDGRPPVLVVPGGPGLASVLPYRAVRRRAAARGMDVLMIEHRGVGLSRRDESGVDLPAEHVTVAAVVDDMAAVLDDADVPRVVVHGSSYGTYLAQAFASRYPERVAGVVLDSSMLSVVDDLAVVRSHLRRLLWDGLDPATARSAALVRRIVAGDTVPPGEVALVAQVAYEFGGPALVERLLEARATGHGRRVWDTIARLGAAETSGPGRPLVLEPDLVHRIAYRELGYGLPPDGHPLDPQLVLAVDDAAPFAGEPFDLVAALGELNRPLAVISGERDLRTPPRTAERIVALAPDAVLVRLAGAAHSALDTHQLAALTVADAMTRDEHRTLPGRAAEIAALPRRGPSRVIGPVISAGLVADLLLPGRAATRDAATRDAATRDAATRDAATRDTAQRTRPRGAPPAGLP